MNTLTETDRIEKEVLLKAPVSKVWQALSKAEEFASWFGVTLQPGQVFEAGKVVRGVVTGCGHGNVKLEMTIERMEPERLFSYRWHPGAIDPNFDYSKEPTTLVVFELKEAPGGTLLTVVESGFDALPIERRAEAFRMNNGGWAAQLKNIETYVNKD